VKQGVVDVVRDFETHRPHAQLLVHRVDNPSAFGVAELDASGRVRRLVEKPQVPPSDLALVGVYLFAPSIAEAIDNITPSARGELEITDAIQWLVDHGRDVRASRVSGWWKDTGKKEDLLHANELVMKELTDRRDGALIDCRIQGPVQVGAGSRLVACELIGPLVIGAGVHCTRSVLGPNTAIGDGSSVHDAVVESSLLMEQVRIQGWHLRNSVLGHRSVLAGPAPPTRVELILGERSEILG
jgi:glucose-1-phosphate thymidylyltransferase